MTARLMGTKDVALRLGCSAERVRQLEREGILPAQKMPSGQRIFCNEDVERLALERKQQRRVKAKDKQ